MSLSKDSKQCYKCVQLLDSLSIEYDTSNSVIIMWNKYQIFIYEDFKFKSAAKVFTPEHQVQRLLVTNDYFLCLDTHGFIHVTLLKSKSTDQLFRSIYQPRDQGIKECIIYGRNECLCLKYDSGTYHLSLYKIRSEFQEIKKVTLRHKDSWPLQDSSNKYFLVLKKIHENCSGLFLKIFNIDKISNNTHFTVLSFDKHNVYGCLFDKSNDKDTIDLIKLYACPSEICSIEIIGIDNSIYLHIGLKLGTVVRLKLKDLNLTEAKPEVIHLNSALHKLVTTHDSLLYTDGVTMWRADNIFSQNVSFRQFFVRNVKDFILCGDSIVCTTFSKMIYTFQLQADESYFKPAVQKYSSAEDLLANSEYLNRIFLEVEKSKELSKQLSIEGSYIAALSLAKRQELMHKIINTSLTVHGSFEEVMKEENELTLTEDISQYIDPSLYLFLIKTKINSEAQSGLFGIVSDIMANCETELQVTIIDENSILKTTSVKNYNMDFLIPIGLEKASEVNVMICLIARIPGTYDKKQIIWTELYRNDIKLTAEHFIRENFHKSLILLKCTEINFEKSIQACSVLNKSHVKFMDINENTEHFLFVRLPQKFDSNNFRKYFSKGKSHFMVEMLSTDGFMSSKEEMRFMVGKEEVTLGLENDGFSNPRLRIFSRSLKVAASVRKFFSDIVYGENPCISGEEFINLSFYTAVENLQMNIKKCIAKSASFKEFAPFKEKFEKEVIGMLPV